MPRSTRVSALFAAAELSCQWASCPPGAHVGRLDGVGFNFLACSLGAQHLGASDHPHSLYNSHQLKTQMWQLLKGHDHLQDEFSVFFDHLRPAASRMGDFEEINWSEEKEYEVLGPRLLLGGY